LELTVDEQLVIDDAMRVVLQKVDLAWDASLELKRARTEVQRAADLWWVSAITLLRLRGLDPAEFEAEIVDEHVTIRPRPPADVIGPAREEGPVRLVVAYTTEGLQPETRALAESYGARFESTDTPTGYWDLLERLWSEQRGFVLLEEDVLPAPGLIDEMWACPREWCSVPYEGEQQASLHASIALVKFSTQLLARVPDAMRRAIRLCPERAWAVIDVGLAWRVLIDEENLRPHWHALPLQHLRHSTPTEPIPVSPDRFVGPVETVMDQVTNSRFMVDKTRDLLLAGDSRGGAPTAKPGAEPWLNGSLALRPSEEPLPWGLIRRPGQRHL
jgi:hypothetical protein